MGFGIRNVVLQVKRLEGPLACAGKKILNFLSLGLEIPEFVPCGMILQNQLVLSWTDAPQTHLGSLV